MLKNLWMVLYSSEYTLCDLNLIARNNEFTFFEEKKECKRFGESAQ